MAALAQDQQLINKKREEFLSDLLLSFRHEQGGVSNLLMYAPTSICFLGSLRFLAYKPGVAGVRLALQENSRIKYPSLTAAIEQLVILSNEAFRFASSNMRKIELQGQILFGSGSVMNEILNMLHDPEYARVSLEPAMLELKDGVQQSKEDVQEIVDKFRDLKELAEDLSLLVDNQLTTTTIRHDRAAKEQANAEREKKRKESKADELQRKVDRLTALEEKAERQFEKSQKNNEWKMFGLKLTGDFTDFVFTTVNEALKMPWLAGQVVESLARIRQPGEEPLTREATSQTVDRGDEQGALPRWQGSGFDLALAEAESINFKVKTLQDLLDDNLRVKLQKDGGEDEIRTCVDDLKQVLDSLEGSEQTQATVQAVGLLDLAIQTGQDVIFNQQLALEMVGPGQESEAWAVKLANWEKSTAQAAKMADTLRGLAVSQAGQGFGHHSSTVDNNVNIKHSELLLRERQAKLEARRQALEKAREDLQRNATSCELAMDQALALADEFTRLDASRSQYEQLLHILKRAVTLIRSYHDELLNVSEYFENITMAIDKFGLAYTRKFLRTIESGGKRADGSWALDLSQYQANSIRETVLQFRVFFKILVDESRLYQTISRECIQPCLSEVQKLPMEEISETEQQAAQEKLREKAVDAKKRIAEIANAANTQMIVDLGGRILDTEKELTQLELERRVPQISMETKEAIKEGVEEAAKQREARAQEQKKRFLGHIRETISDI